MAGTATAKKRGKARAGAKKKEPGAGIPKPAREKRNRGFSKDPGAQSSFLAVVKNENPNITAEGFLDLYGVPPEDALRMEWFVCEYLRDFDERKACIRMGYPNDSAKTTGQLFISHAYCQLKIAETLKVIATDRIVNGAQVVARLWQEANAPDVAYSSNATSRIAALSMLAKILGLTTPKPKEEKQKGPAGGIMFVPMAGTPEEWGTFARESQAHLAKNAAIDV